MRRSGRAMFPPARGLWVRALLTALVILFAYLATVVLSLAYFVAPLWLFQSFVNSGLSYVGWPGFVRAEGTVLLGVLVLIGCAACATSLWALVPRQKQFRVPGPRLMPAEEVRLFDEIRDIADQFGIDVPDEVYLTGDVAIASTERGGVAGFGTRTILVIGLPALQVLTTAQFRALTAAALSHLYTGDTGLSPLITSWLLAMARVLQPSAPRGPIGRAAPMMGIRKIVVKCVFAYWNLLLQVCRNLNTALQGRADALACYVAGTQAFVSGLRTVYRYWPTAKVYWTRQVTPVINSGFIPPLAEGFGLFTHTPKVDEVSARFLDSEMNRLHRTRSDPRPLLRDRIAAVPMHSIETGDSDGNAIDLISNLDEVERRALAFGLPGKPVESLQQIAWGDAGHAVYLRIWRLFVNAYAAVLAGLTVQDIPEVISNLKAMSERLPGHPGELLAPPQRLVRCRALVQSGLAIVLMEHGWEFTPPTSDVVFTRDGEQVDLSDELDRLQSGRMTPEQWAERWAQRGLAGMPLVGSSPPF